jgi:hypothetical protein
MEASNPQFQKIFLYPIPQSEDAGDNLVLEWYPDPTELSDSTDEPFTSSEGAVVASRPYHWGLAYDSASRLLLRDPNEQNAKKSMDYRATADGVLTQVIQVFKALEAEEPKRLHGGRYWNHGYVRQNK